MNCSLYVPGNTLRRCLLVVALYGELTEEFFALWSFETNLMR